MGEARDKIAGLARRHMNGSLAFETTTEQTTGRPQAPKTIATAILEDYQNYKLTRAATLMKMAREHARSFLPRATNMQFPHVC